MRIIKKRNFIILISVNLFNFLIFLLTLFNGKTVFFYQLSYWSFWTNTLYLTANIISDINVYLYNSDRFEPINYFFRNIYSKYSITYSIAVMLLYWTLFFLGESILYEPKGYIAYFTHFYNNLIITIILIIDLFLSKHERNKFKFFDILIIFLIFISYFMVIIYLKYSYNINVFHFMINASFTQITFAFLIIFCIIINSYQIYLFLLKLKDKYTTIFTGNLYRKTEETILNDLREEI